MELPNFYDYFCKKYQFLCIVKSNEGGKYRPHLLYVSCSLLVKSSVCSSQACDRHTEWRATYIVQACVVAELY